MFVEFLNQLLMAVLTAAVPILSGFAIRFLREKANAVKDQSVNDQIDRLVVLAEDVAEKAVLYTNQTYVDALRVSGAFDVEAQKAAFKMSFDNAKGLIPEAAKEAVTLIFGSVDSWLTTQIEASIQMRKDVI